MVRRQVGDRLRQHRRPRRDRRRARRLRRGLPAGAVLPARLRRRRPRRHRANWGRTCSAKTRCSFGKLNRRMDAALKGHPYVKSGIDMACWDILGKATGQPVCDLLGGRYGEDFRLYRAISQESPEAMAGAGRGLPRGGLPPLPAQGRRRPGRGHRAHPRRRREAAARRPARSPTPTPAGCMHDAVRVVRAVRDVDVYIEQPCLELRGVPGGPPAHATTRSCWTR